MRGEGSVPADGLGPGKRKRKLATATTFGEAAQFKTGHHPHGHKRKANVAPGGGGAKGAWKRTGAKAIGTQAWVQDKIAEGDIEGGMSANQSGTSIFDPVLTELVYRWFCPPGGTVLDPFSGGSVRGIVASRLGRQYIGIDLRPEQIKANALQAKLICKAPQPRWHVGDSRNIDKIVGARLVDLVFSCPPYADLEVYSDDPKDLSAMEHADFLDAYADIIKKACAKLRPDRFACFVIGDARDAGGMYYGLPGKTVAAFEAAGLRLYNNAVLLTAIGSLPIRVAKQFTTSRKLGTTHQHVLVFCKGDPKRATSAIGEVEFGNVEGIDGGDPASRFGDIL